jgi:hypothetical protein
MIRGMRLTVAAIVYENHFANRAVFGRAIANSDALDRACQGEEDRT